MSTLKIAVAAQAVVLLVLITCRFGFDVAPPRLVPNANQTSIETGAANRTAEASSPRGEADRSVGLDRSPAPQASPLGAKDADVAVVLYGALLGVEPVPDVDAIRLGLRRADEYHSAEFAPSGAYAVADLRPGVWTVNCEVPGCRKLEFEHTIDAAPVQRLDLELTPATVLRVVAVTTDGERLASVLAKRRISQGLHVVATRAPIPGDLPLTEHSTVGNFGIGRLRRDGGINQRADPDGDEGTLELDEAPPAHATLLMRHLVLARERIVPGQEELRFVVDLDDVLGRFAKVRMRVVCDGHPVANAVVRLSTAQGGGTTNVTGGDGIAILEGVLPGLTRFEIRAKDVEGIWSHLTIEAGADVDLGDVVLQRPVSLRGRVVDADGEAVSGSVQWTALDRWRPPYPLAASRSASTDAHGAFELSAVGRRRYSLRARTEDGRIGFAVVDVATASGEPVVVAVRKAHRLGLVMPPGQHVRAVVVRDRNRDPLCVRRIEPRWRRGAMQLPDGDYVLSVYDGRGTRLLEEPLTIAGADTEKELP